MKKVALVSGWYIFTDHKEISENNRYILECLYNTAKKHFLPDCEVDYIFISNEDIIIDGVKNIKIDYKIEGFWHMCLMKILSLKYVPDDYDAIFVCDTDQIFVNTVNKEDLDHEMVIVEHFYYPTVESIHENITKSVELNFDTKKERWTMGNFFGGKTDTIKKLVRFSENLHNRHVKDPYDEHIHFYTRYPEELFLIKYIYENNIPHIRLNTCSFPHEKGSNYFLSDFQENESSYIPFPEVRLLHNTKKNIQTLKNVINYYI